MPRPDAPAIVTEDEQTGVRFETPTGGPSLARNTLFNLFGQGAPLVAAVFAIPLLTRGLGDELFGVLALAWGVLGYFSLFDLGLGRALTQMLAESLGGRREGEIPSLVWTALLLMLALGLAGGLALAALSPWIVGHVLADLPEAAKQDCLYAFYALAVSVPVVISTSSLRGMLEAVQRFDVVNAIRVPMGLFTFLGPLLILPFYPTLFATVLVLLAGRFVSLGVHAYFCARLFPHVGRPVFERARVGPLVRFGGWMTVSNTISPLMVYADRLVIGAFVSVAAITYYAVPWEVVTKLLVVPAAISGVLFPTFSFRRFEHAGALQPLYYRGLKATTLALLPPALLAILLADPVLSWWIGPEMAEKGSRVMQILAVGVLVNGVAHVPFAFVQGMGRSDLTAKLHVLELPLYGLILWMLIPTLGLTGVAAAWLLRAVVDLVLLMAVSRRLLGRDAGEYGRTAAGIAVAVLLLATAMVPATPEQKAIFFIAAVGLCGVLAWRYMLGTSDRQFLKTSLARYTR